jgi:hypothetical protein
LEAQRAITATGRCTGQAGNANRELCHTPLNGLQAEAQAKLAAANLAVAEAQKAAAAAKTAAEVEARNAMEGLGLSGTVPFPRYQPSVSLASKQQTDRTTNHGLCRTPLNGLKVRGCSGG